MPEQRRRWRKGLWIGLTTLLLFACGYGVYWAVSWFNFLRGPDRGPDYYRYYASNDALGICTLFELDMDSEFCTDPTKQDMSTLRSILTATYPHYDDLRSIIERIPVPISSVCDMERYPSGAAAGQISSGCPPPSSCDGVYYFCDFGRLPYTVGGVTVLFDPQTGSVIHYTPGQTDLGSNPAPPSHPTPVPTLEPPG